MSRIATEQPRAVWCCSSCGAIYHRDFPRCPADGAEVVMTERDPLLGKTVGNYAIDKLIGEGGMGRVYLAHHTNLPNKRYAFKVLLGDHAASTAMRLRFTREAKRASQLDHPNVVKVVDFGQTQHGLLYIAMDYVDGPPLVSLIGDTPMAPARVIQLAREICKGLAYAHDLGIVHRDLKPENILVASGADGPVPRIVDFGLALSIDQSDARLTESGMTMGTPLFAAPEQLLGRPLDHRADLFALGMTMFEMLTGGLTPIDGHMMEVISAKTTHDAPRVSQRAPRLAIPRALDDIVARLTRRKPDDRFASADDVIAALDRVRIRAVHATPAPVSRPAIEVAAAPAGDVDVGSGGSPAAGVREDAALGVDPQIRLTTEQIPRRRWPRRSWIAMAACAFAAAAWLAERPGHDGAPGQRVAAMHPMTTRPTTAVASLTAVTALPAPADPAASVASAAPVAPAAPAPEIEMPGDPAPPHPRRHRQHDQHDQRAARPVASSAVAPAAAKPSSVLRAMAAGPVLAAALPPAASAPRALRATIDGVDVNGSLPAAVVQRAIARTWPAIASCTAASPAVVVAHFTIGEARRARNVRAAGATASARACVSSAFTELRTEAAPDIGDVDVTVRIAFVVKT